MKIGNYDFKKTCDACPEQYDVFDEDGAQVAYIRLRWGWLYASCPDVGGTIIYEADVGDGFTGCFNSDNERMAHLRTIADRIKLFNQKIVCPYCGYSEHKMDADDIGILERCGLAVIDCYECDRAFAANVKENVFYVTKL